MEVVFNNDDYANGLECFYVEKHGACISRITKVKICNGEYIDGQLRFGLVDAITGDKVYSNYHGMWYAKPAFEKGIVIPSKYFDYFYKICPECQQKYISTDSEDCEECRQAIEYRERVERENRIKDYREFFCNRVKLDDEQFIMDDEQLDCLTNDSNTIITARAGSGKTRVLVAKLVDLIFNQRLNENEILALCFNRSAADNIRERLNVRCKVDDEILFDTYKISSTFHSLAKKLTGVNNGILSDNQNGKRRILFKLIIEEIVNNNDEIYEEFKQYFLKYTSIINNKYFATNEDYYHYLRNSTYDTLKGERVKSIDEKFIADFLFEHNIDYIYEYSISLALDEDNRRYIGNAQREFLAGVGTAYATKPDFYLPKNHIIWEHWGVDGSETETERKHFSSAVCDYQQYINRREWKINLWKDWRFELKFNNRSKCFFKSIKHFMQTSYPLFKKMNREEIENYISKELASYGVVCHKLSDKEIIDKVMKNAIDNFTKIIGQFIDKYEQKYLDNEEKFKRDVELIKDERVKAFLNIGYEVFKRYDDILKNNKLTKQYSEYSYFSTDFERLIHQATRTILSGSCDDIAKGLKWILIDEYQDLSKSFNELVNALISRNNKIKLFCVGDDWQAINRFAGSDTYYFSNFEKIYPMSKRYYIHNNYRSRKEIVDNANKFMLTFRPHDEPSIATRGSNSKSINYINVIKDIPKRRMMYLFQDDGEWGHCTNLYQREVEGYLSAIINNIRVNNGKEILFLTRNNYFLGKEINELKSIIKNMIISEDGNCYDDKFKNIEFSTIHRSKGLEADIVYILGVDEKILPSFHPDKELFDIFENNDGNNSLNKSMIDEQNLYYVALTRAKEAVYILYSDPSYFVTCTKYKIQ